MNKSKLGFIFLIFIYVRFSSGQYDSIIVDVQQEEVSIEIEIETTTLENKDKNIDIDTISKVDIMPKIVEFVEADYPKIIYSKGIEGKVCLDLLINEYGIVESVFVAKTLHPQLDLNAREASKKFKFTPAIVAGDSVPVMLQYEYHFSLHEVLQKIDKYINFKGKLVERGTRLGIPDALIVIDFIEYESDTTLDVSFEDYINRIAEFDGQYIEDNTLVTVSDSLGEFRFYSLPSCSIMVECVCSGFERFWQRMIIPKGEEIDALFRPRKVTYSEYEIIVYGKNAEKEVSQRKLTLQEVKKIPGVDGDAIKVIQTMPGVGRPTSSGGDVIVRGSRTWDTGFYLDGTQIPNIFHFFGVRSTYNSDDLKSIDYYAGGFSARYGGHIAGIVDINARAAKNDRLHISTDMNLLDLSAAFEVPVGEKMSVMGSVRRSVLGNIAGRILKKLDELDMNPSFYISPFYWDYQLRSDIKISESNTLALSIFGSRDSLEFITHKKESASDNLEKTISNGSMFHTIKIDWDVTLTDKCKNSFIYSLTFIKNSNSLFDIQKMCQERIGNQFRNELSVEYSKALSFYPGLDITFSNLDLTLFSSDATGISQTSTINNWWFGRIGAYFHVEWKPIEKLIVMPGFRYDYFPQLHYDGSILPAFWDYSGFDNNRGISGEPSLRIAARYNINKKYSLKLSIGNYNQSPKPEGWVIHDLWGNTKMPATKAAHYTGGFNWQITDLFSMDTQIYFNRQWDIPRLINRDESIVDAKSGWVHDEEGRMYGLEFMLRYNSNSRFFGWLSYTWSRSERRNNESETYILFDEDLPHYLQLIGSYKFKRDWNIGLRFQFASGKPETPVVSSIYIEDQQQYIPVFGEKNSTRMNPFFQLGIRFDKKLASKRFICSIYLDMQNILAFFYDSPEYYEYNYDFKEKEVFAMIPLATLGLKFEF